MSIAHLTATDACAKPVNPQWVKLRLPATKVSYERCAGADWFTSDGENSLSMSMSTSMRAGLATLDVLENKTLGDGATSVGVERQGGWRQKRSAAAVSGYGMVKEVRGKGLSLGIEFTPPCRLPLPAPFEAFVQIRPAMFGQILVLRRFRNRNVLTQICGNDFMVLKLAPPLVVTAAQVAEFVWALHDVVDFAHRPGPFWSEATGLARRAIGA
ncbi:MAG TPA: aminotransferase class III-fold pyridoxal phosphate-dependent enzyme [Candidatus Acidoferrales bacterium]|nr:aminotransferase class III-fold pyridoxal phosphate-dependent enzyme [Candidatus Acidoferrales bacterium]